MVRMRRMVNLTIVIFPPPKRQKTHQFAVLTVPCKYFWWIKSSRYLAVNYDLLKCYCEYDMGFPDKPRNSPLSGWRQQEIEHLAIHLNSVKDKAMTEQRHCRSICILPQNGIVEITISANLQNTDNFLLPINCLVTVIISWSGGWHFLTCDLSLFDSSMLTKDLDPESSTLSWLTVRIFAERLARATSRYAARWHASLFTSWACISLTRHHLPTSCWHFHHLGLSCT